MHTKLSREGWGSDMCLERFEYKERSLLNFLELTDSLNVCSF